ncbi:acyltransferase [Rhodoferax sp.]|uniref:LpxL/LpxP family acyltransferase n=1 Tax=Rhodoferax sp. TaxID=50421 RepID=UPI0019F5505A|nr:acyltransferase [Rhodoferax sp.]MBE0474875.1 acyltransferase [Rhodoferax sp.]
MTASTGQRHWAQIGESTFVTGIWLLYGVHRLFGRVPFLVCMYPVVAYYWATSRVARQASMEYLKLAHHYLGVPTSAPGWRAVLRHFLSFAATLLDKTLITSGRYRFDHVRFEGLDAMLKRVQRREGGIFITAHMGCLELCQALADRESGLHVNVLVHTRHAELFNRILRKLNPKSGVTLMQVTEFNLGTAILLAKKVAAGEYVAIAGDRVPVTIGAHNTLKVDFLGRPAVLPIGPYIIASLLKCPLFWMGCIREGDGHVVVFELLAQHVYLPRRQRAAAATVLAQQYVARVEALLRRAPFEWFNFFPFWDQPGAVPVAPNLHHEKSSP